MASHLHLVYLAQALRGLSVRPARPLQPKSTLRASTAPLSLSSSPLLPLLYFLSHFLLDWLLLLSAILKHSFLSLLALMTFVSSTQVTFRPLCLFAENTPHSNSCKCPVCRLGICQCLSLPAAWFIACLDTKLWIGNTFPLFDPIPVPLAFLTL